MLISEFLVKLRKVSDMANQGIGSISYKDYDGQTGIVSINTAVPSAGNFATLLTNFQAFKSAVDGVVLGAPNNMKLSWQNPLSAAKATDPNAMRGNKWVIKSIDSLIELAAGVPNPSYQKPFDVELPTADLGLRVGGRDQIWAEGDSGIVPEMDALVAAFEDIALSPNGGPLVVQEILSTTRAGG